ncbi:MAG: hypothetical protein JNM52_09050, partial [Betaproteobacteria bacterium]|nr:hypothetical protein [Betaproteobacteria bacterium]
MTPTLLFKKIGSFGQSPRGLRRFIAYQAKTRALSGIWPTYCAIALSLGTLTLSGCDSTPKKADIPQQPPAPVTQASPTRPGAYYLDDGPGDMPPANLDSIPDAVPRNEALHRAANRPYTVLGRTYVPNVSSDPFRQEGVASWYGRKYHGQKTSIGEIYDMYAMTAAHPTLPLPSYVRVTNTAN